MSWKGGKAPARARSGGTFSYLGSEVTVTGDIATESELHLDGKVGRSRCGSLTQGESGECAATSRPQRRGCGAGRRLGGGGRSVPRASARSPATSLRKPQRRRRRRVEGRFKRRRGGADGSASAKAEKAVPPPTPLSDEEASAEAAE